MLKLDLETLKHVKHVFELHGDCSTSSKGYKYLCEQIEKLETPKAVTKSKVKRVDDEDIQILIENLNEHRT